MKNMKRRRSFKRKTAFLLALSMACSFPQAMGAQAVFSGISLKTRNAVLNSSRKDTASESVSPGKVKVLLSSALVLENEVEFTAKLLDSENNSRTETMKIKSSQDGEVSFDNLPDGTYTLEVSAPGFATYMQSVQVARQLYSVRLTAGFCEGFEYGTDGLHPGVVMIGDVNKDNIVNDTDKDILIDVIDGSPVPENCITDLNKDGKTDLKDLTLFSESYNHGKADTTAFIEESISPDAFVAEVSQNTSVEGDISEVLSGGEGTITLSPRNDEEISEDNPVEIALDVAGDGNSVIMEEITFETGADTDVEKAFIDVTYIGGDGEEHTENVPMEAGTHFLLKESGAYAEIDENGNISVHLGQQVAVKKVSLKITAMASTNNLVEISKVEFLNGMEERIPAPQMDIPENLTAKEGSARFSLSWNPCSNVKGYEVKIESGGKTEIKEVVSNSLTLTQFCGDDIKNYTTYTVSVQSVNGTWSSGFCEPVEVTPKPTGKPDKPDNVKATGKYRSISVGWKNMDDTQSYNVYYRLRDSDDEYTKISGIPKNSYTIPELEETTEYEIYVTGVNELGESPQSLHCSATTTDLEPIQVPRYNMINRDEDGIPGKSHIVSVTRSGGEMVNSGLDNGLNNTAWGAVDGDETTYYKKLSWDDGGFNGLGGRGLTYTFDDEYKMDTIVIVATQGMQYSYIKVQYWDSEGKSKSVGASCSQVKVQDDKVYHLIKLAQPVNAEKIQIGLARYLSGGAYELLTVSDTYFYRYNELWDEIMDLYVDDLHTVLREDVTMKDIEELEEKIKTPDEFGVENSEKEALTRELETAKKILNAEEISSSVKVHNGITSAENNSTLRGFSGINAWQPLGVVVGAQEEEVTVYVGCNNKKTGDATDLRLICTQYHSESGSVTLDGANLKVGANTFQLKKNMVTGVEGGGALYIQYQGAANSNNQYSVRVTGGSSFPILDLYGVTDETTRKAKAVEYITELDEYVPEIESLHNEIHKNGKNKNLKYDYDSKNCILGASDIMLDTMMLSLPAQQILAGTGTGSAEQRAETLLNSMQAMEDMMYLFYQHKGLNKSQKGADGIPSGHLNIRYQRMFSGAFMYASGNHIGIEWGSAPALMQGNPIESDEDGKYISGNYFGWGIAHEIGHNINQGAYTVAEITNNYFAQLAQAKDTNEGMRFQYQNIYNKVTSGTKGDCSNIATQLGMYWQLHLAYDKGLNYKTYANYNEQLANLFYARVDTYARTPSRAPAPNNVTLTLSGGTDQCLMRLACAASERNVLEFFERWGKTPDAETKKYAEQFPKETRAIFYANDDSRVYALKGGESVLGTECSVNAIGSVSVSKGKAANQVELKFNPVNIPQNDILGYEVIRCTISGGQVEEVPVGFSTTSTFTDTVTTMNNRAVFYKVTLIDNYLNRSASFTTDMTKIEHDGSMDKTNWTVTVKNLTEPTVKTNATEEMPCDPIENVPTEKMLDNNLNTAYTPSVNSDSAEIVIDFHQTLTATGLKYTAGAGTSAGAYEVYVQSGGEWIKTAEGAFNGSETVYFANDDNQYISTYSATAVKLVLLSQQNTTVSIAELDVLSPTGDNVDFRRTVNEKTTVIGTLSADYQYGETAEDVIPKDSLVFTGSYKGNPAYNVVILYDDKGNIVGGIDSDGDVAAQQIILADVPENSNIANVSDGTWIYWIEPDQLKNAELPETVRVELYRVNNALTNEGQRLVSDSLFEEVPDTLPDITFGK